MLGSDHTDGERPDITLARQGPQAANLIRQRDEPPLVRLDSRQVCGAAERSESDAKHGGLCEEEELIRQQQAHDCASVNNI